MKILAAKEEALDVAEPYKLLYLTEGGYATPDGDLKDLGDFENTVLNIPFKVRVFFEWVQIDSKGTYALRWYYVDGSEWDAYSDIDVEAHLGGFVEVDDERYYEDTGESEFEPLKVFMESDINYVYYSSPIEDAMYEYLDKGAGHEDIFEKMEDELDTDDKVIVEIEGLMDMQMRIKDLDVDNYDNCTVSVEYDGKAKFHDVKWSKVPKSDEDYEWI